VWGFELVVLVELRSIDPIPVLPESTVPHVARDALWLVEVDRPSPEAAMLWAGNFFDSRDADSSAPVRSSRWAAFRLLHLWIGRHDHPMGGLKRNLMGAALAVWLTRHARVDEMKQALTEWEYFGRGAYGMNEASRAYFGREPSGLTVAQIAVLVGLPQLPTRYGSACKPEQAAKRRTYVLTRMRDEHLISDDEFSAAASEAHVLLPDSSRCQ